VLVGPCPSNLKAHGTMSLVAVPRRPSPSIRSTAHISDMTLTPHPQNKIHRQPTKAKSEIKTEADRIPFESSLSADDNDTSFPLLWPDLDPDDNKKLPNVHVIFLEKSMSASSRCNG
jgi:hypothetical protein